MKLWAEKGNPYPLIRSIEPLKTVYKKCLGGIIVCATIPEYAQVRGKYGDKCRASAALITNVLGIYRGQSIGVSLHDKKTTYRIGDVVEIDDFDMSDTECSTGFHFFCSEYEARRYNL